MMDSKSVVVVKAKYRLSISICIPLSGKVVSFLSNWNQAGVGGGLHFTISGWSCQPRAVLTFLISSPSYKLLWHEFPRPGLLTGAAYDVNTGWWEEHTMLVLPIGLSCRGCRRRMWTEIIWLSSDTSGYNKTRQIIWFPTQGSHPGLILTPFSIHSDWMVLTILCLTYDRDDKLAMSWNSLLFIQPAWSLHLFISTPTPLCSTQIHYLRWLSKTKGSTHL